MLSKKAISPVVAIALLLVVSVVAVVGFQNWYTGFQSGLLVDTEQKSSSASGGVNVEFISSDGIIYITNIGTDNVSMSTIKIGNIDCNINQNLEPGVNNISVASCLNETGTNNIILVTDEGIIEESLFVEEINIPPFDCSSLNGGDWVLVPGNPTLGTTDFCVMKYEAKFKTTVGKVQDGSTKGWRYDSATGDLNITSLPTYESITYINQTQAMDACKYLGNNYHLISNAEWTTIARNAEQENLNWNTSIAGEGFMFSGNNDNGPGFILEADSDDNNGYYGTGDNLIGCDGIRGIYPVLDETIYGRACAGQRRTLILSNNEVIWDLGGNVWEWNSDTCLEGDPWYNTTSYLEWNNVNINGAEKDLAGPLGNFISTNGVGIYYQGCSVNGKGFIRGGWKNSAYYAGVFTINLANLPSSSNSYIGFRCAYTP